MSWWKGSHILPYYTLIKWHPIHVGLHQFLHPWGQGRKAELLFLSPISLLPHSFRCRSVNDIRNRTSFTCDNRLHLEAAVHTNTSIPAPITHITNRYQLYTEYTKTIHVIVVVLNQFFNCAKLAVTNNVLGWLTSSRRPVFALRMRVLGGSIGFANAYTSGV